MFYYKIFGLSVESEIEMSSLNRGENPKDIDVKISRRPIQALEVSLTKEQKMNPYCCFTNHGETVSWLYFPFQGQFCIENGKNIYFDLNQNFDKVYIEQVLLCTCMTILLLQRGEILLHGSVLAKDGKALVISGESGAGKSTLTDYLLGRVPLFLSDDIAAVRIGEQIMLQPSFPLRKLCADAIQQGDYNKEDLMRVPAEGREKYLLPCKEIYAEKQQPFYAMVVLHVGNTEEVSFQEITGAEKIKYLTENLFRGDVYQFIGMDQMRFLQCVKIANQVRIFSLTRPKEKMTVERQAEFVMKMMQW